MSGSGTVLANGSAGASTVDGGNDAPGGGGGGGGGTIIAQVGSAGSVAFNANGGNGGSQIIVANESEGPGGGGGGGVISVSGGAFIRNANGGANGTTDSGSMTEFLPNGATRGATGQPTATAPSRSEVPLCYAPPPTMTKTSTTFETTGVNRFNVPQADVIYTMTVTNPGTQIDSGAVSITDAIPPQITFYNGDIDDAGPLTTNYQFIDGSTSSGLTCCTVTYSQQTSGIDFSYTPTAGYDPNVKRIQITASGAMAPGSTTATSFQVKFRGRIN